MNEDARVKEELTRFVEIGNKFSLIWTMSWTVIPSLSLFKLLIILLISYYDISGNSIVWLVVISPNWTLFWKSIEVTIDWPILNKIIT